MRMQFFKTPKPKKFSFHTRYYNENKLQTEDEISLEKGSFKNYQNKYRTSSFEKEYKVQDRNRRLLIFSIFLGLLALYIWFKGFFTFGLIPGVGSLLLVLLLLKKASSK